MLTNNTKFGPPITMVSVRLSLSRESRVAFEHLESLIYFFRVFACLLFLLLFECEIYAILFRTPEVFPFHSFDQRHSRTQVSEQFSTQQKFLIKKTIMLAVCLYACMPVCWWKWKNEREKTKKRRSRTKTRRTMSFGKNRKQSNNELENFIENHGPQKGTQPIFEKRNFIQWIWFNIGHIIKFLVQNQTDRTFYTNNYRICYSLVTHCAVAILMCFLDFIFLLFAVIVFIFRPNAFSCIQESRAPNIIRLFSWYYYFPIHRSAMQLILYINLFAV